MQGNQLLLSGLKHLDKLSDGRQPDSEGGASLRALRASLRIFLALLIMDATSSRLRTFGARRCNDQIMIEI